MPKKHLPKFLKSQPSLHTSHASSSSSSQNVSAAPAARDQSVNDLLAHLRTSQPNSDAPRRQISTIPSVPPSLQLILANAEPPPPPHSRPQIGVLRGRRNRIPGPPPPASWLAAPEETSKEDEAAFRAGAGVGGDINRLPDLPQIKRHRLAYAALIAVARNWRFHTVYDQHYLYALRPGLKALLLSYIATHNTGALQADDLRLLFRDGDDEDFTHLDLSRAVGPNLTFKDLRSLFHGGKPGVTVEALSVSDDWDAAADTAVAGHARFAAVTHISLAWPAASEASWARLMMFVGQCVPTITHLSLAGWGHPGAAGVLRRFARSLLCLKWLDVSDCPAGIYDSLREEVEWDRAWRGVETVVCVQAGEGTPQEIKEERGRAVAALREHIRGTRAEVGGRWCRIVE
ncbi:hypothetical protein DFP73DRAFT_597863 [Morchella snyderi]|nr:hypothetical protein DFP73DRAFT_597863 [Morchella snyderi]